MSSFESRVAEIVGEKNVVKGDALDLFTHDWKNSFRWQPRLAVRPADTSEVAALVRLAREHGVKVVPAGGHTGLNGGTFAEGAMMISLDRMNLVEDIRPEARVAVVQAGVVLSSLHDAVADYGLSFPLTFGARGSAMIGGCLSTNAGGSNVLRYGNTRALALGIEVVLPDGRILDLMSALHKDNTGYDLRDLFIGAEGTLGIITRAVVKLVPTPAAYATALVSVHSISDALILLNRLQDETGGLVEAFEYMPRSHIEALLRVRPDLNLPLGRDKDHTIMVELGATAARDATPEADGTVPLTAMLENTLATLIETGLADDAVIAQNQAQRRDMWTMREMSAEAVFSHPHFVDTDVSVPLDAVADFVAAAEHARTSRFPDSSIHIVSHLGDGNVHYTVLPATGDKAEHEVIREMIEDVALSFGGSFSAEHGIGLSKLGGMKRRKNPVALDVMRTIKAALDPDGIMNPGKVIPE